MHHQLWITLTAIRSFLPTLIRNHSFGRAAEKVPGFYQTNFEWCSRTDGQILDDVYKLRADVQHIHPIR